MEATFDEILKTLGVESVNELVTRELREQIECEMSDRLYVIDEERSWRACICTRCKITWVEQKVGRRWPQPLPQGEFVKCPKCSAPVLVKHTGRGYSEHIVLNAFWYVRVDEDTVAAVAARCVREIENGDETPWNAEPYIVVTQIVMLRWGEGGARWTRKIKWEWNRARNGWEHRGTNQWRKVVRDGVLQFGMTKGCSYNEPAKIMLHDSVKQALQGTKFARAWSEEYFFEDGTRALAMIAKYPCIEYLTKLELNSWLTAYLDGAMPRNAVNWRGKSMEQVLRLTRQELGQLKAAKVRPVPGVTVAMQEARRMGARVTADQALTLTKGLMHSGLKRLQEDMREIAGHFQPTRRTKALKYLCRKIEAGTRASDVMDYWNDCAALNEDMNSDEIAFPRNLNEMHTRMTMRRKVLANKETDAKIAEQLPRLERQLAFEFGGLLLRPARDAEEVIREGAALHHCVGGYVQRYADGKTAICVLRRAVQPDEPWRTVEIDEKGRLVQDRGYRNDWDGEVSEGTSYSAALECFWAAWRERGKERKTA